MSSQAVTWRAAPRLLQLATVSLLGVLAAIVTGRASLLLLAVPALVVLAVSGRPGPATLEVEAAASASRCFEGEDIELTVTLVSPQLLDEITVSLELAGTAALVSGPAVQTAVRCDRARARWVLRPGAWGRRRPGLVCVRCRCGGAWQAELEVRPGKLEVFPHPPPARAWLVPAELRRRIGEHTARTPGAGIEFGGIRDYVPGDRLRDVNWAVSRRHGRLHTNQRGSRPGPSRLPLPSSNARHGGREPSAWPSRAC